MTIYERIKTLCKQRNMTVESLMASCNLRRETFSKWQSRDTFPRADSLYDISRTLGVSVEYLFTGKEENHFSPRVQAIAIYLENNPEKVDAIEILLFEKSVGQSSMVG